MGKLEMGDGVQGWGEGVGLEAPEKETMLPDWARRRQGDAWLYVRLTFLYFQHYWGFYWCFYVMLKTCRDQDFLFRFV